MTVDDDLHGVVGGLSTMASETSIEASARRRTTSEPPLSTRTHNGYNNPVPRRSHDRMRVAAAASTTSTSRVNTLSCASHGVAGGPDLGRLVS
jgi:hypothetical protein